MGVAIIHADEISDRDSQGAYVALLVKVGYPGSRVSDVWIGEKLVQLRNEDIQAAAKLHDEYCDTEGG